MEIFTRDAGVCKSITIHRSSFEMQLKSGYFGIIIFRNCYRASKFRKEKLLNTLEKSFEAECNHVKSGAGFMY